MAAALLKPTFSAGLIGSRVSHRAELFRVMSLHSTAAYLLSETDGRVVSVVGRDADMSPTGIRLLDSYQLFRDLLSEGEINYLRRSSPSVLTCGALNVHLSDVGLWTGEPDYAAIRIRQNTIRDVRVFLASIPRSLGQLFAPESSDVAVEKVRQTLSFACRQQGDTRGTAMIEGLVGLGRGLTPAGDDFLAGAMLADDLTRAGCVDEALPPLDLNKFCRPRGIAESTTPVSVTLLESASLGFYPAYLLDIVRLLSDPADVAAAVSRAAEFGATSGLDSVSGLCWAVSRPDYQATYPPSTTSGAPVTNEESSVARKSAAEAISPGRPMRPSG